jgi:hypothetical protein
MCHQRYFVAFFGGCDSLQESANKMPVIFYEGWHENMFAFFFLSKCNCNNNEVCMDDSLIFAIMRLFLYKVFVIFSIRLQTFSKMLYTNVVKFPASTLEHIT